MPAKLPRKIFVNLPVRALNRSIQFFSALGFTFNPRLTDDKAACMVISDEAFVMLLTEPFFKTFTHRRLCNTAKDTEGLFALSCRSKAEVDEMVKAAIAAGGKQAMDKQEHGFMYGWSFYDLDGHHWEVIWMDSRPSSKLTDVAKKSKNDPQAVDTYLATLPRAERDALERLRVLIKKTVPHVEERISYGTTVMFSLGRDLVGFVSQPSHLSFFTASPKLAQAMKDEIMKTNKVSGATIHFSPANPLPTGLVTKILRARVRENATLRQVRSPE